MIVDNTALEEFLDKNEERSSDSDISVISDTEENCSICQSQAKYDNALPQIQFELQDNSYIKDLNGLGIQSYQDEKNIQEKNDLDTDEVHPIMLDNIVSEEDMQTKTDLIEDLNGTELPYDNDISNIKKEKYLKKFEKRVKRMEVKIHEYNKRIRKYNQDPCIKHESNKLKNNLKNEQSKIDTTQYPGDWYTKRYYNRAEIRKNEKLSDWFFDRSTMRNKLRNKALWYFERALDRENLRAVGYEYEKCKIHSYCY
ncbi:hypothetical protein CBL_13913 [Carabus blaptoides fortunei]